MKTATRTVSGANTADAPPVGPENRTAGKNRFRMVVHETLSVRRREVSPRLPHLPELFSRARTVPAPAPPATPPVAPQRLRRSPPAVRPSSSQASVSRTPQSDLPTP